MKSHLSHRSASINIWSRSGLSPVSPFMQHTTTALSYSDQTTLTEHMNLPNSLPNFRLVAIRPADVERS